MTAPLIGVGVPVWRGAAFVAETLESVLNQRGVQFKLFISIDGADADSERACLPFASDPRVRIVVQPRRLGWVKNTAAVLAGAGEQAEFVCVQPHDDWIETDYLATLLDAARDHPKAAVVFSDLAVFGTHEGVIVAGECDRNADRAAIVATNSPFQCGSLSRPQSNIRAKDCTADLREQIR